MGAVTMAGNATSSVHKTPLPILKAGDDYIQWRDEFEAWLLLHKLSHLHQLEPEEPEDDDKVKAWIENNAQLYSLLQLAVRQEIKKTTVARVKNKNGAAALKKLEQKYRGKTEGRRSKLETKLVLLRQRRGEHPSTLIAEVEETIREIDKIDERETDEQHICNTILRKLNHEYHPFKISIKALDLRKLKIDKLEEMLIDAYEEIELDRRHTEQQDRNNRNRPNRGQIRRTPITESSNYTEGTSEDQERNIEEERQPFRGRCFYCHQQGHMKWQCEERNRAIRELDQARLNEQNLNDVNEENDTMNTNNNYPNYAHTKTPRESEDGRPEDDWEMNGEIANELNKQLGGIEIDLFASKYSKKAERYYTRKDDAFRY